MKISVIVPVYNVALYLEKCMQSLVEQSLQEIQILAVDDGSTDRSPEILLAFQQRYPHKIKVFTKENGGLSDARNFALDVAQGEYIAFVDSDDYVSADMLQDMYALAQKHEAEMVVCNLQKVDIQGQVIQKMPQLPHLPEKIDLKNHFSVFADLSYFACNKIFKKELFQNRRFRKGMHFEDIELIPQLLLSCNTVAKTDAYHYHYLQRSDSITKTHTDRGLDILKAVAFVEQAFYSSRYAHHTRELKNFQILEGVYSYLAYLAFVKEEQVFEMMYNRFREFMKDRKITLWEIIIYRRFGRNYLWSLPWKKISYYLLCFSGQKTLLNRIR